MRNDLDLKFLKSKLGEELMLLTQELGTVGKINPDNPKDWIAKPAEMDTRSADLNDVADGYEAYDENAGVLNELEIRFNEVKKALSKIDGDSYGLCDICGKEIESDRLGANPAATTCKEHM